MQHAHTVEAEQPFRAVLAFVFIGMLRICLRLLVKQIYLADSTVCRQETSC